MSLAIKCIRNLSRDLSYVSTLLDIVQKLKFDTMSWSIDTWDRIHQGIIDKGIDQWQTWLCACV